MKEFLEAIVKWEKKNIRFTDIVLYGRDCGKMIPLTSDPLGEFVREKCFLFRLIRKPAAAPMYFISFLRMEVPIDGYDLF